MGTDHSLSAMTMCVHVAYLQKVRVQSSTNYGGGGVWINYSTFPLHFLTIVCIPNTKYVVCVFLCHTIRISPHLLRSFTNGLLQIDLESQLKTITGFINDSLGGSHIPN